MINKIEHIETMHPEIRPYIWRVTLDDGSELHYERLEHALPLLRDWRKETATSLFTIQTKQEIVSLHGEGRWIVLCPLLDVLGEGSTKDEALAFLENAMGRRFISCLRRELVGTEAVLS